MQDKILENNIRTFHGNKLCIKPSQLLIDLPDNSSFTPSSLNGNLRYSIQVYFSRNRKTEIVSETFFGIGLYAILYATLKVKISLSKSFTRFNK